MTIDQTSITFLLGLIALASTILAVYNSIRKPQIKADLVDQKIRDELDTLKKTVQEIKETHLRTVEQDIKNLTGSVNELSKTVVRLATIIDERIPKGSMTTPTN